VTAEVVSRTRVRPSGSIAGWFVQKPTDIRWAFCVVDLAGSRTPRSAPAIPRQVGGVLLRPVQT